MEIGSAEWSQLIIDGAGAFDIDLNHHHTEQFAIHARDLIQWTKIINITSITDPFEIAIKHFLDSLAAAPLIPPGAILLDVGSGGGFPGLPLKILIPSLTVALVDASRKKVSFLKHVIRELALDNINALHCRVEDLAADPTYTNKFEIIISRALTSLESFVNKAVPLMTRQGYLIAMKGKVEQKELDDLQSNVLANLNSKQSLSTRYGMFPQKYSLPYLHARRSIVLIRRFG